MRSSICAQSCDSVPPAPGWIETSAPRRSHSPESRLLSSRSATCFSTPLSSLESSSSSASSPPAPSAAPRARAPARLARRLLELPHRATVLERQVGRLGERALGALGGEPGVALLFAPPARAPEPEELLRLGGRDRQHRVAA